MPLSYDPEVLAALHEFTGGQEAPKAAVGDVASRRQMVSGLVARIKDFAPPAPTDVTQKDYHVQAKDGHSILLRWYAKTDSSPGSAVYYMHGGGMIAASINDWHGILSAYVSSTGVPFLAVEFRSAPEHPQPTIVEDAYAGLVWLAEHAAELGVDPQRIAVMGDSGGGGIAACLAHYALTQTSAPRIKQQILIYPMLDDRNTTPDPHLEPFALWSYDDNITAWDAILGTDRRGKPDGVPPHHAAGRMTDATGLPPLYIDCGELDIFRDECMEYAKRFSQAGVPVELHIRRGCMHAFDEVAAKSTVAKRMREDREKVIRAL